MCVFLSRRRCGKDFSKLVLEPFVRSQSHPVPCMIDEYRKLDYWITSGQLTSLFKTGVENRRLNMVKNTL